MLMMWWMRTVGFCHTAPVFKHLFPMTIYLSNVPRFTCYAVATQLKKQWTNERTRRWNKNAKKLYSTQIFVRNDVDWLNNRFCSAVAWKSADIWSISASTWSINRSIDRNSNRNIDKCYSRFRSIENGREIAAFVFEKIFIRSMVGTFSTLIVE